MSGRKSKKEPPLVEMAVHAVWVVVGFSSAAREDPRRAAVKSSSRDRETMVGVSSSPEFASLFSVTRGRGLDGRGRAR